MVGFDQVMVLFLLILVGFIVRKMNLVSALFQRELAGFVINVALPAMIITSISVSISDEMLRNAGWMLLFGALIYALSIFLSYVLTKVLRIEGKARDVYQFILTFPNVAYMGYPVVAIAYGEIGVFYAAVLNMIFNIMVWSFGVFLMKRNCDDCDRQTEKMKLGKRIFSIMNPALYALFIGFGLALLKIRIPDILMQIFDMVGGTTSPLSMMFIGFTLTEVHLKELVGDFKLYLISFIRLIGFPVLFYFMLTPFASPVIRGVVVLLMAMPGAVNTAILAANYKNDYKLAGKLVFVSTLASIVTIPIMIKFVVA